MTTYHVDPAASGSNNGTSWTDAWTSLQSAADTATAGDTVYCRGTQNISAAIDFDTGLGSYSVGYIKFIGCNASGVVDGTRFVLKRASGTINGIYAAYRGWVWLENFSIEDCNSGIAFDNASYWCFVNVRFYNNTAYGLLSNSYAKYATYNGCQFVANGSTGCFKPYLSSFNSCIFTDNVGLGVAQDDTNSYTNCIMHNNGGYGIDLKGGGIVANCVIDSNAGGGIKIGSTATIPPLISNCRITNHNAVSKLGIDVTGPTRVKLVGCYFGNNTTDITDNRYDIIPINGATDHVIFGGSDTNHGYTTPASDDFNLRSDASIRSYAVPLS